MMLAPHLDMPFQVYLELRVVLADITAELDSIVMLDFQVVFQEILEPEALPAAAAQKPVAEEVSAQMSLERNRSLLSFAAESTDFDVGMVLLYVQILR